MDKKQNPSNNKWVLFPSYSNWTYGDPSAGPSAKLPRPASLFPREQTQNSRFRGVDLFTIFIEVLSQSHGALPRKLFVGVAWKCVICISWWAGHCDNVFGCTGGRVIKVVHSDFELQRLQVRWVNHFSWSYLPYRWARGLSVPPSERLASAKLLQRTWTLLPKTYQHHCHMVFTTAHVKQIANTLLHRIKFKAQLIVWHVKGGVAGFRKTHFRETSTLKPKLKWQMTNLQ